MARYRMVGVPHDKNYNIRCLPTLGRRNVNLGYKHMLRRAEGGGDWFERDGLRVLGPHSHIRNNVRLSQQGKQLQPGEPLNVRCDGCQRTLANICGYSSPSDAPNYRVAMIQTDDSRYRKHFCWDCAGSRQTMIAACPEPHWQPYISTDDRDDVFGFIEQVVFEDQLADEVGIDSLQCHNGSLRGVAKPYRAVIDGRLLTLRDAGEYLGLFRRPDKLAASGISPAEIDHAEVELEASGEFDPTSIDDARMRVIASIVRRRGQAAFRQKLIDAYDGRCAISGCDAVEALEAAHIVPYRGDQTNDVSNGILLRADLHTLFDLGLIGIDPSTMTVVLASSVFSTTYKDFDGASVCVPENRSAWPNVAALKAHRKMMLSS